MTKTLSFTDKGGNYRGSVKNDVITVWQKPGGLKKKEWSVSISVDEIDKMMNGDRVNHHFIIWEWARDASWAETEKWIKSVPQIAAKRRYFWENRTDNGKWSALDFRERDSIRKVVEALYEKYTGHPLETWWEKGTRERRNGKRKDNDRENRRGS